ncbi:MAG TPA: carboxypeptidase regulatory-like domain-containing protein [Bacteroidia bacterium]|nr:carboxypeptidase regulatory-like domain-containing protein [Bacteroidia bacterium]
MKVHKSSILPFFISLFVLFCSFDSKAQFTCKIEGIVKQNGKPLGGATVSLSTNTASVKEVVTGTNGSFSLSLEPNEEYNLYVTKPGFIKSEIVFSTMGFTDEEAQTFKNILKPEISLFELPQDEKALEKINSVLNRPMKSYYYNAEKKGLVTDEAYDQSMQKEFAKIQKIAEEAPKNPVKDESEINYQVAVTKADKAFGEKNYSEAQKSYEEAVSYKPSEQYPKSRLNEINKIKIAQDKAMADAKAAEEKRLAEEKKLAEQKALTEAKEKERLEKEALAKAEEEKRLADAKEKQRLEQEAIAKAAEEKRLAEEKAFAEAQEKERLEKEAIAKAEEEKRLAAEKAFAEAKEKERLEKEKELALETEKRRLAAEAEAALLENNYKTTIFTADSAFKAKSFSIAKAAYNKALQLKSQESYPKERILEIEQLLATVYKNDLAKKYPQGVTEEIEKENNSRIIKRIVVDGNKGTLYIKRETGFGQSYYFKDGTPITEQEFKTNTEPK